MNNIQIFIYAIYMYVHIYVYVCKNALVHVYVFLQGPHLFTEALAFNLI